VEFESREFIEQEREEGVYTPDTRQESENSASKKSGEK